MVEDNSFYYENGGTGGGVYWCDACDLTATNAFYQDHVALDGSIGHFNNGFDVTIDLSSVGLGKAFFADAGLQDFGRGGGFFISSDTGGADRGDLTFSNCDPAPVAWVLDFGAEDYTITHFESEGDGGLIYSAHLDFHLLFDDCVWNNYRAKGKGGIIYGFVQDFQKVGSIAVCAATNITADLGGAFFSSQ